MAQRVGVMDLTGWLQDRRAEGWSLQPLSAVVGHGSHWVRCRLPETAGAAGTRADRESARSTGLAADMATATAAPAVTR